MQYMAPWVPAFTNAVTRQLESNQLPFITCSFATVDSNGSPRVRTCIYRGFVFDDKKTNVITLTTDIRMEKYEHLTSNPKFETCFWFPTTNEQFRISGNAKILTTSNTETFSQELGEYPLVSPTALKQYSSSLDLSNHENHHNSIHDLKPSAQEWEAELKNKWESLSRNLKSSFRKPDPGSVLTPEKQKLLDSISRGVDGSNEIDGTKNFGLVLLLPENVDYVNLNGHQSRYKHDRVDEDQWDETEICP
ncbi:hypothetical protein BN7_5291 [Wickerhamomyces ciferrii]|uniref:Pyridoxamine 5'-phosphate oxidase Alr4036 family FMN-binding domain-containing protein n=1 Tax=Wickerhamomyces ciferrii (strain ATCC 14091 / BCRC 22168 / CBS 111 / JCM 3599 / NBRC 0793 / NRRL Y-1031 F-60-10) TaxID=1206466 RepID=K0KRD2_WICCF|nr:uncharacterized protein BN7_5291 [Wickerhamomyces ciferrii]CCH45706.1 hypothetical protein BN7_5291 [Wickerhamomyces ciferrii]